MLQALLCKRSAVSSTTLDVIAKSARRRVWAYRINYIQNEGAPLDEKRLINDTGEEKTYMHALFFLK
jgi:hypothetical protein